jgi:hypothetical protein
MIPKIEFRYSGIYDRRWMEYYESHKKDYPPREKILKYITIVEKKWGKISKKILKDLSAVTGLKWTENKIVCYVVGRVRGFSDPLTLGLYKSHDIFIDNLIHELIHQLLSVHNHPKKYWRYIYKKYSQEQRTTKNHIPVHAIHKYIYLKYFGKKNITNDKRMCERLPEYKRSWEIVEKEGHEDIIKELRKRK